MTQLKKWPAMFAAFVLAAALTTGVTMAQNPPVQDTKAQEAKVFEGSLMAVDQNAKVLTLKGADKEMRFSFTDQTELVTPPTKDGKPPAVTQGAKMRIHYMEHDKTNIATKIEVIEPAGN
jgi:hypothetical protein